MKILLLFIVAVTIVSIVNSSLIHSNEEGNDCPPPEQLDPCTCFKDLNSGRVTVLCSNFSDAELLRNIFDRNPGWKLQDVHIDRSIMAYIPASLLERAQFQRLNVSFTTLVTLFDKTPVQTPELNLYLYNLRLQRGFVWSTIANSSLIDLGIFKMAIRRFGRTFKENIPKVVRNLFFENTDVQAILDEAFSDLHDLQSLVLDGGNLKTITRNMFPSPWKVRFWSLK
ncbi:uncharacterized protein CEXT_26021 [Caerostris extrusa]|uniref:Uncharacterized protein n=1 Tax=Caerostris extrusa TaxID=172846 RepID=A0AAV4YB78_CAEEX|nr:uncharacterized protein CEXT_26021 [Caerostris extrusa]